LENPQLDAELTAAREEVRVAEARVRAADGEDAAAVRQALHKHAAKLRAWELAEEKRMRMTLRAPADGTLVRTFSTRDVGKWVTPGEPAAKVVEGPWHVHAVLDESTMATTDIAVGDEVWCRPERRPDLLIRGTVTELAPAGSQQLPDEALSSNAGGPVPLHPMTGMPERDWYRFTVRLDDVPVDAATDALAYGGRVSVKLPGESALLGRKAWRGLLRFRDRLMLGE
ncbi:MAG: HlyD family efflux transporter periplasmic adaptor subunit, partial [Planctomycetota bacterium]